MEKQKPIPQTGKRWFTPAVEKQVRTNDRLILMIAEANKVRVPSVHRWFNDHSDSLTTIDNLELIRAELGYLEIYELIEKQTA